MTNMKPCLYIILVFSMIIGSSAYSQESLFEVLPGDSVIHIQIETNLKTLIKAKNKPAYQPGAVTFLSGPLAEKTYETKVKARGNLRRRICYYPPIWVKFSKTDFQFHKVKVVNLCKNTKIMAEYVLKEYLAYKIYEELTDHGFKTRLLKIDITNPETREVDLSSYGFFIEPVKELANRTSSKNYEPTIIRPRILDRYFYALMTVFEYLIGNTDWHIDNLHNLKFLRSSERNSVIPVPYDFDYAGLVDASYAVPHESLPIKSVTERYNKARCLTKEERQEICELVLSKKEAILELVKSFEPLSEKTRIRIGSYLENGFKDLESEKLTTRVFVKNCREN